MIKTCEMEGATPKVLLQTPPKSVERPTDSRGVLEHILHVLPRTILPDRWQKRSNRQVCFFSFYGCFEIKHSYWNRLVCCTHTHKPLNYPLNYRQKHNPVAKLNTQLNLVLERDGPVVETIIQIIKFTFWLSSPDAQK